MYTCLQVLYLHLACPETGTKSDQDPSEEWVSISQEDPGITLHQHHHYPRITHSLDERDVVLSRADIGIIFALQVFLILRLRHISQTAEIRKPQGQINNKIFVRNERFNKHSYVMYGTIHFNVIPKVGSPLF